MRVLEVEFSREFPPAVEMIPFGRRTVLRSHSRCDTANARKIFSGSDHSVSAVQLLAVNDYSLFSF